MASYADKTDEELVICALKDHDAFGILIERYEKQLGIYIHRLTNVSHEEGEDLLQEVFLKAYLHLHTFDPSLKFSSWLYRITHNIVISGFRKKKVRPREVSIDERLAECLAGEVDLQKEIDRHFLEQQIDVAMKKMDQKYRDVIILKYIEEKSYQEISDILQLPQGTVSVRLNRAKKILQKLLDV